MRPIVQYRMQDDGSDGRDMSGKRPKAAHAAGAMLAVAAVLAGCASAPPDPSASSPSATPAAAVASVQSPSAVARASSPMAEPSPAQAKAQAQRLALEAVDQLQNGDETGARGTLDRALELDPANDLARKLQEQVRADAEKELGPVSFRYTVQRDDSLSKLAQQFLGDRLRFYLLAKYNGITNPSRLAVGQVLRIPGKPPAAGTMQTAGVAPSETSSVAPGGVSAKALIGVYEREAAQAFQRQDLDLAIAKWDRVLELDPTNRKARLERERAVDLQKKMNEKFGAK